MRTSILSVPVFHVCVGKEVKRLKERIDSGAYGRDVLTKGSTASWTGRRDRWRRGDGGFGADPLVGGAQAAHPPGR